MTLFAGFTRSSTKILSNLILSLIVALIFLPTVFCQATMGQKEFDFDFCEVKDDMLQLIWMICVITM